MNFIKIKWFNTNTSLWNTDYVHDDDEKYCIISFEESNELYSKRKYDEFLELDSTRFSFIISKNIVQDILCVLTETIRHIYNSNYIRVINLGFSCENDLITGSFAIQIADTDNNAN